MRTEELFQGFFFQENDVKSLTTEEALTTATSSVFCTMKKDLGLFPPLYFCNIYHVTHLEMTRWTENLLKFLKSTKCFCVHSNERSWPSVKRRSSGRESGWTGRAQRPRRQRFPLTRKWMRWRPTLTTSMTASQTVRPTSCRWRKPR